MGSDEKVYTSDLPFRKFIYFFRDIIVKPVVWFRESIVEPNRQEYYWYHEKVRRVPTVDECLLDDYVCIYEADQQFELDRKVDLNILEILRKRYEYCCAENMEEQEKCIPLYDYWQHAITNFFIKYGELGFVNSSVKCLMKQKHRMAWERRHGPVGTGKKSKEEVSDIQKEK